jgi:hypothetical protein
MIADTSECVPSGADPNAWAKDGKEFGRVPVLVTTSPCVQTIVITSAFSHKKPKECNHTAVAIEMSHRL